MESSLWTIHAEGISKTNKESNRSNVNFLTTSTGFYASLSGGVGVSHLCLKSLAEALNGIHWWFLEAMRPVISLTGLAKTSFDYSHRYL